MCIRDSFHCSLEFKKSCAKLTGCNKSGGKPPSPVTLAIIERANGKSKRGQSMSRDGCNLSSVIFENVNTPA